MYALYLLLFTAVGGANLALGYSAGLWLAGYRPAWEHRRLRWLPPSAPQRGKTTAPTGETASVERVDEEERPEVLPGRRAEDGVSHPSPAESSAASAPEISPAELLLVELRDDLLKWRNQLPQLDEFLRDESLDPRDCGVDEEIIGKLLLQVGESRDWCVERLVAQVPEAGTRGNTFNDLRRAIEECDARAKRGRKDLEEHDPEQALGQWRTVVRAMLDDLLQAADLAQRAFAACAVELAGRRKSPGPPLEEFSTESTLGMPDHAAALYHWRLACEEAEDGPALAVIDMDQHREVNEAAGLLAGDRVAAALAEFIKRETAGDFVARAGGGRFLIVPANREVEGIGRRLEQIRQMVEAARFLHEQGGITVTVSGAVVLRQPGEAAGDVVARLEATLAEAKNYGRNRTFLNERHDPVPVVPPALEIAPQTVQI